ncbi:flocculation protein FLO11-like [Argentina anserina]|uniref:flocculation protein FLO11-like n=1 Tax=Argentina anserina TaxID=57926 RepID=UPI0021766F65|nr:flocculation protein FLO11-like [Potentilla anserina]XP_050372157.1 flocculation protein FLO11-like [Potentilla anserina]
MKLEREPVFGQLSLTHKPDFKPFDHKEITQNSGGLQSGSWIGKESQNRVLFGLKDNEEVPGQNDATDLTATKFDCSKSVDDLSTCDEREIKSFVPENLESLEKQSDYYMDKSVTDYDLPEQIVCYKESSCNTIKDICIDEGVPSQEKNWFETNVDEKAFCNYLSPDDDQKKPLVHQQMDIITTIPDDFKSSAQKDDVEKDLVMPCDAKDLMQIHKTMYDDSEKITIDGLRSPENELSMHDLQTQNVSSKSSSKASSEAEQDTVQILNDKESEIAQTHSSALDSATEEFHEIENGAYGHVDESSDSNKVDNNIITVGLDRSAPVSISRFPNLDPISSTERSNCLVDELSNNVKADRGSSICGSNCSEITRDACPHNGFSEHLDTQYMAEVDSSDICETKVISSQVQPCSIPVTISREDLPEDGACQRPETSKTSMVDEGISNSEIVSSQVQHSVVPSTIAGDECPKDENYTAQDVPVQAQCELGESSFSAGVPFGTLINLKEPVPSSDTHNASGEVQHDQGESSFSAVGNSLSLINSSGPIPYSDSERFLVQRDLGDSSFAATGHVSSLINNSGPILYSGSISLRSDSSATSTRSFAFPVMHPHEPFSSPVRMAKADRRLLRKHRGWKQGIFCCRF